MRNGFTAKILGVKNGGVKLTNQNMVGNDEYSYFKDSIRYFTALQCWTPVAKPVKTHRCIHYTVLLQIIACSINWIWSGWSALSFVSRNQLIVIFLYWFKRCVSFSDMKFKYYQKREEIVVANYFTWKKNKMNYSAYI